MNLKSLHARLDKLEKSNPRFPSKWRIIHYLATMDATEEQRKEAEEKAKAEDIEKNGPFNKNDGIICLVRRVNEPRTQPETLTQAETLTGPPQDAQDERTAPEATPCPLNSAPPETATTKPAPPQGAIPDPSETGRYQREIIEARRRRGGSWSIEGF